MWNGWKIHLTTTTTTITMILIKVLGLDSRMKGNGRSMRREFWTIRRLHAHLMQYLQLHLAWFLYDTQIIFCPMSCCLSLKFDFYCPSPVCLFVCQTNCSMRTFDQMPIEMFQVPWQLRRLCLFRTDGNSGQGEMGCYLIHILAQLWSLNFSQKTLRNIVTNIPDASNLFNPTSKKKKKKSVKSWLKI